MPKNDNKTSENISETSENISKTSEYENEIARNEEYIDIQLFKDNGKYKDDVYVAVGNENCVIKRGFPVKVKRKFWNVIEQSMHEDFLTARLIEEKTETTV